MQCVTLLLILVDSGLKELYLPLLVTGIYRTKWWVWKHICQYQWSWDKPYSLGRNHLCPTLQFESKHVCIEDVHIFKHCREITLFLLWIGTYCVSCVVQQTSGVKDLSSLVRYDDSSLAAIRHVESIIPLVLPRPNIHLHSVLLSRKRKREQIRLLDNGCKNNPFHFNLTVSHTHVTLQITVRPWHWVVLKARFYKGIRVPRKLSFLQHFWTMW